MISQEVDTMAEPTRNSRRRGVYVRQNKSYQILLAILVVAFIIISVAVVSSAVSSGKWSDTAIIRMIFQRRSVSSP